MAGNQILSKMFKIGPYGSGMTGKINGRGPRRVDWMKLPRRPRLRAEGGDVEQTANEDIPIIAAGGEYVIGPDEVRRIGDGDRDLGHRVLDAWVTQARAQTVSTLKNLPGPAKS